MDGDFGLMNGSFATTLEGQIFHIIATERFSMRRDVSFI